MALRAEDGQVVMRGVSGSVCVYVKELEAEVRIVEREGQRGVFDAKHRFHEAKAMRVFRSHLGGCRHSLRARILQTSLLDPFQWDPKMNPKSKDWIITQNTEGSYSCSA
jgi:hypothetical protein